MFSHSLPARRALAGLAVAGLVGCAGPFLPAAHADGQVAGSLGDLGSCVAEKGKLDVILAMDETESLIHNVKNGIIQPDVPGSDADHYRVPAAQSFVDELLAKSKDEGFSARIKLAGFGQEYHSGVDDPEAYGDWTDLNAQGAESMKKLIEGEKNRTSELYTNYANALTGAYQEFARTGSPDSCKLLITFTDGALTAAGGPGAAPAAQQEICRDGGIADQYRAAGITNIGIGLSDPKNPSDFSLYKSITQGDGGVHCGAQAPNGAFFPADSVGSLFGSFHKVLSTGGDFSKETRAEEGFSFMLDKSVDSVRFTALAQDDLGKDAYLELTSPTGDTLALKGEGTGQVGGADITWVGTNTPAQKVTGDMRLTDAEGWEGEWKMRFVGFDDTQRDGRVFNTVRIQPDLQVQIAATGADAVATDHGVSVRSDDTLLVSLVGRDGQPRTLEGDANARVVFTPADGGEPTELLKDTPIGSGEAVTIPLDSLTNLPATGHVDASVAVTTKGSDEQPGTELEPVVGRTDLSVTSANMPQMPGNVDFSMDSDTTTIEVPVTGPGTVWVPEGSTLDAEVLPEGIDAIDVSSKHNSPENALTLKAGEKATLPVTVSVAELKDGIVQGTLPIRLANSDGGDATTMALPVAGTMSVPLNKGIFAVALVVSLLLALLLPLALTYLVRYLVAKIPSQYYGALRIPLTVSGDTVLYNGSKNVHLSIDDAARNQVPAGDGRSAVVRGYPLQVRSFNPNPLAAPYVHVDAVPSIAGTGAQVDGAAKLPLAVHNTWFIAADPTNSNHLDLVVLPRLPLDAASRDALVEEIENQAPRLVSTLRQQAADLEDTEHLTPAPDKGAAPTAAAEDKTTAPASVPNPFDAPRTGGALGTGALGGAVVAGDRPVGIPHKPEPTPTETPQAKPKPQPQQEPEAKPTPTPAPEAKPTPGQPAPGSYADTTPDTDANPFTGADTTGPWNPYATDNNPFSGGGTGLNFEPADGDEDWGDDLPWDPHNDKR